MKKTLFIISLPLLLVCSCTKEVSTSELRRTTELIDYSFSAAGAEGDKSSYYGQGSLIWNMWDQISVLDGYDNRLFTTSDEGTKATFSGSISSKATKLVAIYPYSNGNRIEGDNKAVVIFPNFQNAVQGGFCAGANPSIGQTSVGSPDAIYMQNLGSYLKFTIPEGEKVSTVFIEANGEESLSGPLYVTYGSDVPVSAAKGGYGFVTLVPRDSYTFEPGTYYAIVNPVTLGSGLKFIARRPDGKIGIKSGTTSNTLIRNKTKNLGTIDLGSMSWQENSLYANDTITLDFSNQPFIEDFPTAKTTGYVEYHTRKDSIAIAFWINPNAASQSTRGAGWYVRSGDLCFYPNTGKLSSDKSNLDGITIPARQGMRLKKVNITVGNSNSFKAEVYTMGGTMVAGGFDSDSTHFNSNGNWLKGITAEMELVGTKPNTPYKIVAAALNSFVIMRKIEYIYERLNPIVSVGSLEGVGITDIQDSGSAFDW